MAICIRVFLRTHIRLRRAAAQEACFGGPEERSYARAWRYAFPYVALCMSECRYSYASDYGRSFEKLNNACVPPRVLTRMHFLYAAPTFDICIPVCSYVLVYQRKASAEAARAPAAVVPPPPPIAASIADDNRAFAHERSLGTTSCVQSPARTPHVRPRCWVSTAARGLSLHNGLEAFCAPEPAFLPCGTELWATAPRALWRRADPTYTCPECALRIRLMRIPRWLGTLIRHMRVLEDSTNAYPNATAQLRGFCD